VYHISLWQNEIKHAQQLVNICPGLLFAMMSQELGHRHPCIQPRQPYASLTTGIQHSRLQLWILHGWNEVRLQCIPMPYSCVQRDHQATQHSMYKAGTLFKPPGCMGIGLELLAAQALLWSSWPHRLRLAETLMSELARLLLAWTNMFASCLM